MVDIIAVVPSSFSTGAEIPQPFVRREVLECPMMNRQKKQSKRSYPRGWVCGLLCSGIFVVLLGVVSTTATSAPLVSPCSKPLNTNFLGIRVPSQRAPMAVPEIVAEIVETEPMALAVAPVEEPIENTVLGELCVSVVETNNDVPLLLAETLPIELVPTEPESLPETVKLALPEPIELAPLETDCQWESVSSTEIEPIGNTSLDETCELCVSVVELLPMEPEPLPELVTETELEWEPLNPTTPPVMAEVVLELPSVIEPPLIMPVVELSAVDLAEFEKELRSLNARLQKAIAVSKMMAATANRGRTGLRRTPQPQRESTDQTAKNELLLLIAAHYYNAGKYDDAARMLKQIPEEWRKEFLRYVLRSSSTRLEALPYLERWVKTI